MLPSKLLVLPSLFPVPVDSNTNQYQNDDHNESNDHHHPHDQFTVRVVRGAGAVVAVKLVIADKRRDAGITETFIGLLCTVSTLVASCTVTLVVRIKAVCPVCVITRVDSSGCNGHIYI